LNPTKTQHSYTTNLFSLYTPVVENPFKLVF